MKKSMSIVFLISIIIVGCENPSQTSKKIEPKYADFSNATALFTGSSSTAKSVSRAATQGNQFYKIDNAGNISPVTIKDSEGNNVNYHLFGEGSSDNFQVYLTKTSRNYICFPMGVQDQEYFVLADLKTGKLYDFRLFTWDTERYIPAINDTDIFFEDKINNEVLFNWGMNTLYRFDPYTLVAMPLNNKEFDKVESFITLIGGPRHISIPAIPFTDNTVLAKMYRDNKGNFYKFDRNGVNPPVLFSEQLFYAQSEFQVNLSKEIVVFADNDNSIFSFFIESGQIQVMRNGVIIESLGVGVTTRLDKEIFFQNDTDELYIFNSGILSVSDAPDGVSYSWKPLLVSLDDSKDKYYIKGNSIYYLAGSTFKIADIDTDTTFNTFYTHPREVRNIWMVNEDIYFTGYNTATTILTYLLKKGTSEPLIVSSSETSMANVIELHF